MKVQHRRPRTNWPGGASLFALGVALGLALAASPGHPAAGSHTAASSPDPGGAVAAAPRSKASPAPDTKLNSTVVRNGDAGGRLVIVVPPPEPELCSPVHITVGVGQTTWVACRSANYDGPIIVTVANPAIATVVTSNDRMLPRYLVVTGHDAGTTIVRVTYPDGPMTQYPITVFPA